MLSESLYSGQKYKTMIKWSERDQVWLEPDQSLIKYDKSDQHDQSDLLDQSLLRTWS